MTQYHARSSQIPPVRRPVEPRRLPDRLSRLLHRRGRGGAAGTAGTGKAGTADAERKWGTPKQVRRGAALLVLGLVVIPLLLGALYYWIVEVPTPTQMKSSKITTLLDSDGVTVLDKITPSDVGSTLVPLSAVPVPLRDAVLAAEDRDFYRNPGFSVTGFLRAVRDNLTGDPNAGGGSTITQQYVKNALLTPKRSLLRKMREVVIASKMAKQWSKDEILDAYLNTIYFGRGAYGVADAAQAYFGKPLGELTVAEDAVLAAVIREPSLLSQPEHRNQLEARWSYVLDGMAKMGKLNAADRAATKFPVIPPPHAIGQPTPGSGPAGLIRTQVMAELAASGIPDKAVNGLQITTTIDPKAQAAAVDAVHTTLGGQPPNLRAAVVSVDPRSGAVRAYYGGADPVGYDFAQAPLQTGSTFKVFGLIAGLENGVSLSTQYSSAPVTDHGITITNVGGESCGTCSISKALEMSLNTSFYRMEQSLGPNGSQLVAEAAHRAGIPKNIPGVPGESLSQDGGPPEMGIILGQYLVRPIDMASGYATVAAAGEYHEPYFVQKVVDGTGNVLLDRGAAPGLQRIPTYITQEVTSAMLPIAGYSNRHQLAGGRPSAAKTGTTQLGKTGQNKDAWMIGFTPSLSTAVWIGSNQAQQPIRTGYGGMIYGAMQPADIWAKTMNGALAQTPVEQFVGVAAPSPIIVPGPPSPARPAPAPPAPPLIMPGPPPPR
ncbi:MAG: penicillin-binding protein, partial [Mycobacteriaceae bacterium]|nr:penicillin-binding protein [Mycobacteriaceae bacterium]